MGSSRLFWKIFSVYAGLNLLLVTGCLIVVYAWQRPFALGQVKDSLYDAATVLAVDIEPQLDADSQDQLQRSIRRLSEKTETRITVIDPSGAVLADSHESPTRMANHLDRPEVQQAMTSSAKLGTDQRTSSTLGISMFYLALPMERDGETVGVVRVAKELAPIDRQVASVVQVMLLLMLGIGVLATLVTYSVVGRIMRPLTELTRVVKSLTDAGADHKASADSDDELGTLGAAFEQLHRQLAQRMLQLKENNERLANVMSNMVEGVITVGVDERIVLANEAGRRMLDIALDEVERRPLWEVTRTRVLQEAVAEALESSDDVVKEFETGGFPRRTLTLRASRLSGEPSPGVMLVLHDVTDLRRLENLRREFVANVSHELKTPLSSIKAYAETLRMGAVNDSENNLMFVGRIEEQADRLHELILDLLQIARIESGQQAFEITAVSVAGTVDACVKEHAAAAASKRITLVTSPSEQAAYVRADEEGLRTILNNLVDNAVKYTPDGGRVTVRWRVDPTSVTIEVQDTGIGIAKQHHARVFERFYRVDKARSRELGGTGLGLSIVKHLSQSFGGSVGIDSQLREGSTFRVILPRAN